MQAYAYTIQACIWCLSDHENSFGKAARSATLTWHSRYSSCWHCSWSDACTGCGCALCSARISLSQTWQVWGKKKQTWKCWAQIETETASHLKQDQRIKPSWWLSQVIYNELLSDTICCLIPVHCSCHCSMPGIKTTATSTSHSYMFLGKWTFFLLLLSWWRTVSRKIYGQ